MRALQGFIEAHLIGGEVVSTGDFTLTEQDFADEPGQKFDGSALSELDDAVELFESMAEDWPKMKTISLTTKDHGSIKIATHAIAYMICHVEVTEVNG